MASRKHKDFISTTVPGFQDQIKEHLVSFSMKDISGLPPKKIAAKLLKSEQVYVDLVLSILMNEYRGKLVQYSNIGKPILSDAEITKIFINLDVIYDFHKQFLQELVTLRDEKRLLKSLGPSVSKLLPFFKLYSMYIQQYESAKEQLTKLGKSKKFREFIEELQKFNGLKLSTLLKIPVSRLPQYLVYMGAMIVSLEPSSYREDMEHAMEQLSQVTEDISTKCLDTANRAKVVDLQTNFFKNNVDIVDPARVALKYGTVNIVNLKKSMFNADSNCLFVLFNDMIIIGTKSGKPIRAVRIEFLQVSDYPGDKNLKSAFKIECNELDISFAIGVDTDTLKAEWVNLLSETISFAKETSVVFIDPVYFEQMIFKKAEKRNMFFSPKVARKISELRSDSQKSLHSAQSARTASASMPLIYEDIPPPPPEKDTTSHSKATNPTAETSRKQMPVGINFQAGPPTTFRAPKGTADGPSPTVPPIGKPTPGLGMIPAGSVVSSEKAVEMNSTLPGTRNYEKTALLSTTQKPSLLISIGKPPPLPVGPPLPPTSLLPAGSMMPSIPSRPNVPALPSGLMGATGFPHVGGAISHIPAAMPMIPEISLPVPKTIEATETKSINIPKNIHAAEVVGVPGYTRTASSSSFNSVEVSSQPSKLSGAFGVSDAVIQQRMNNAGTKSTGTKSGSSTPLDHPPEVYDNPPLPMGILPGKKTGPSNSKKAEPVGDLFDDLLTPQNVSRGHSQVIGPRHPDGPPPQISGEIPAVPKSSKPPEPMGPPPSMISQSSKMRIPEPSIPPPEPEDPPPPPPPEEYEDVPVSSSAPLSQSRIPEPNFPPPTNVRDEFIRPAPGEKFVPSVSFSDLDDYEEDVAVFSSFGKNVSAAAEAPEPVGPPHGIGKNPIKGEETTNGYTDSLYYSQTAKSNVQYRPSEATAPPPRQKTPEPLGPPPQPPGPPPSSRASEPSGPPPPTKSFEPNVYVPEPAGPPPSSFYDSQRSNPSPSFSSALNPTVQPIYVMQFFYFDDLSQDWVYFTTPVPEGAQLQYDPTYGYYLDGYGYTDGQFYLVNPEPPVPLAPAAPPAAPTPPPAPSGSPPLSAPNMPAPSPEASTASSKALERKDSRSDLMEQLKSGAANLKKVQVNPEEKKVPVGNDDHLTKNLQHQLDKFRRFVKEDKPEEEDEDWF